VKYLLLLTLLFSFGCRISDLKNLVGIRKFQKGDCLILSLNSPEKWDKPTDFIVDVGNNSYLTCKIYDGQIMQYCNSKLTFGHFWESFYQNIPCGNLTYDGVKIK